jgi:predicted  nucleic acid-binding Zn-ribbon protein
MPETAAAAPPAPAVQDLYTALQLTHVASKRSHEEQLRQLAGARAQLAADIETKNAEIKDLDWEGNGLKKENARLVEELTRLHNLQLEFAQSHASVLVENAGLKAAAQAATAVAEGHRAAEIADRAKILAALQGAQSDFLGASWDYALSLRRGEQLERREQQLERQLATVNAEVAALRDARLWLNSRRKVIEAADNLGSMEARLARLETDVTCLIAVKVEQLDPGSDFDTDGA